MRCSIPLALLLASPCCAQEVSTGTSPQLPVHDQIGAREGLNLYRCPPETFSVQLGAPRAQDRFVERPASFPSPIKTRWETIHGTYYVPSRVKPGQRLAAAVVVHHLGGSFEAEALLAQHLAQHGMAAFFISLPNYGKRREPNTRQGFLRFAPETAFRTFRQAALDVIRAGDFLRSRPEVDPSRVGAVGVSLGAIVTALARGVDPRLRRTVLVLAGGDLLSMFSQIDEGSRLLAESGVDPERLPALISTIDPLTFANRVATPDVLMLNASRDEIVPPASTRSLWRALGRPKIRWFDCGHYGIVLHILTVMNATLDHLRGRSAL